MYHDTAAMSIRAVHWKWRPPVLKQRCRSRQQTIARAYLGNASISELFRKTFNPLLERISGIRRQNHGKNAVWTAHQVQIEKGSRKELKIPSNMYLFISKRKLQSKCICIERPLQRFFISNLVTTKLYYHLPYIQNHTCPQTTKHQQKTKVPTSGVRRKFSWGVSKCQNFSLH